MWVVLSGCLLGWALGANDAANIFGPAVSSNILKFWKAAILASICIVLGALIEGIGGIHTIGKLTSQTPIQAFICMLSAGCAVILMTYWKLPVSTSQAVVGAVIGVGLMGSGVEWGSFLKVVICWIGTPIGAGIISFFLYLLSTKLCRLTRVNFFELDFVIRWGLILCCIYGAYALGANNVANTTGVFVKAGVISPHMGLLIGSLSIVLGILTFSQRVIRTVGKSVVPINGFSALISLLSSAITVHFYAKVGVPVSASQAIIGSVIGIGLIRDIEHINFKILNRIFLGWIMTPAFSLSLTIALIWIFLN